MKRTPIKCLRILAAALALMLALSCAPALAAGFSALVSGSGAGVYLDPGLTQQAVTLSQGEVVIVKAYKNGVAQIAYQGKTGFMSISSLTKVDDVAEKAIVNTATRVYQTADKSSASRKLARGAKVYILGVSGDWARIEMGGVTGYTYINFLTKASDYITPTAAPAATPTATAAPAPTATPVPAATPAPTVQPTIDASDDAMTLLNISAVVSVSSLPVYKSASTKSKKLTTLKSGAQVVVKAYKSGWALIEQYGNYGFCALAGLTKASDLPKATPTPAPTAQITPAPTMAVTPTPPAVNAIPATVTVPSLIIFGSASTNAARLGTLSGGAKVNVLMASKTWAYIELNGNYGYCLLAGLTKDSDLALATPTPAATASAPAATSTVQAGNTVQFTATVVYPTAKVYSAASTAATATTIAVGVTVNVYAFSSDWAYVGVGNNRGYMPIAHLNRNTYATLSVGDSSAAVLTLQKALEDLGYFDGIPAGNFSSITQVAVQRFQSAIGVSQSGTADQVTLRILYGGFAPNSPLLSAGLSSGATGSNVQRIQTRLYYLGYLSKASSVDGDYGATTTAAVKLFQAAAGISASGAADAGTIGAMYQNNAPKRTGGNAADVDTTPADPGNGGTTDPGTPSGNAKIETVISTAQAQLGKPYVYGATGTSSFDCSGLTQYCFKKVGVTLKRSAYAQGYDSSYAKIATVSAMKRGDVVCMNTISDSDLSDHVGIYLGGGYMIHASSGGGKVMVSSLTSGYYNRVFSWGRRILG